MSLKSIIKSKINKYLFTTPSHNRKLFLVHKFYEWYKSDISEIDAIDPETTLNESEKKATKIYKTKSTHYLTNGSTSGIISAVLTCCKKDEKILIWNKSHPCHLNAAKLANAKIIEYELNYNKNWGIYEPLNLEDFSNLIEKYSPKAIIVTSPTYEGLVSNIKKYKEVCEKHETFLIVDEAHGALYPFSEDLPSSAVNIADFTIQSLHKTAGGINPTALLHNNTYLNPKIALNMINTTSPSYPMLATIEANINYLNSSKGKNKIKELINEIKKIKENYKNIEFYGDDTTKILIKHKKLSGEKLSNILYNKFNIEDEKTNEKSTMLLTGLGTSKTMLKKLHQALKKIDNM